jgi:superfamily II DNA or RNA helicase
VGGTSFIDLLRTLDPDPHTRGKQFERLTKWWLTNTPVTPFAPLTITKLWLWDEWPDRPGPDIGIDLVAELSDGSLCAIQAKCIDEDLDIPKSQLDSFISAASTKVFTHRLLVGSTDGLSANARRMLHDQHVIRVMRTELETSLATWPTSINDLDTPVTQEKWKPLPHQGEAITNVTSGLATVDRGQMIMACGTGKTLTALWITEALNPTTTLVLVPSLNLLSQTLFEWARHTTSPWTYICVCSDDTVNKNNDEPITTVDDFPFEVTTDPTRIATFLETSGRKVIFSTYQSSAQIATALQTSPTTIDFAICDEAHRLTGKTDADYATILENTKIPAAKRLFMTATPRTYTPTVKKKAEERGVEVTSMDDETTYGPVLHKLSFGEAINRGLLSDYKVVIVGVTDPQVQELIDRRELVTVNNDVDTDARTLAAHIGLAKATKDYNLARTISFHSRINTAAKFAQDHPKILDWLPDTHRPDGTTWTDTISGAMNTGQRRRLLNQLRIDQPDRHALLTNARCLTEGVDVPTLDGVAFIDPRSSQVDIIQAVGRAIRKSSNKETGIIVLPVLVPSTANIEEALNDTVFKPVWGILNALKAHDEDLKMELVELRVELGKTGVRAPLPEQITIDAPIDIDAVAPGFVPALELSLIEHTTDSWNFWFGQLLRVGASRTPRGEWDHEVRGINTWIQHQRNKRKDGSLLPERQSALDSLPFWSWDPYEDDWQDRFRDYCLYLTESGNPNPAPALKWKNWNIGSWVHVQRQQYKNGLLPQHRIDLLSAHPKFVWEPERASVLELIEYSREFFETHGHLLVPQTYVCADGYPLGKRIAKRRWDIKTGKLKKEHQDLLEKLDGWTLVARVDRTEEWLDFLANNHDPEEWARVADSKTLIQLKTWLSEQRKKHKKGILSIERQTFLESLPWWTWDHNETSWQRYFDALTSFADTHGHCRVPRNYVAAVGNLSSWTSKQRSAQRRGTLAQSKKLQLEQLQGWSWEPTDDKWWLSYERFIEFLSDNPDFELNRPSKLDLTLRDWLAEQRRRYRDAQLTESQVEALEKMSSWTWEPALSRWHEFLQDLRNFVESHGHCVVPNDYQGSAGLLSPWCFRQRKLYQSGSLSPDLVKQLEQIPSWTWVATPKPKLQAPDPKWMSFYSALTNYINDHGTTTVKKGTTCAAGRLDAWVFDQRKRFRKNELGQVAIELLEALPGWYWGQRWTPSL